MSARSNRHPSWRWLAVGTVVLASVAGMVNANVSSAVPDRSGPALVRAVAVTPSQVQVEWEPGTGDAGGYVIRRNDQIIAEVDPSTLSFTDGSVVAGSAYDYTVEPKGPDGPSKAKRAKVKTPSPPDQVDTFPPTTPEDVDAVDLGNGQVLVGWQYGHDDTDISSYVVFRDRKQIAVVDAGTLHYIDRPRGSRKSEYSVEAVDTSGLHSPRSESAGVHPPTGGAAAVARTLDSPTAALAATAPALYSPTLRRYPYLTDVVNDGTAAFATVNWATNNTSPSSAQWGLVDVSGNCTLTTSVAGIRTGLQVNSVNLSQWKAEVSGLQPDTAYCYRVYTGTTDLLSGDPTPTFRTLKPAGSSGPVSFAVFGDWGSTDSVSANPNQAAVMQQIANSGVDFAVTTGDNAYPSGSQGNYGDLVEVGPALSAVFGPQFWTVAGAKVPLFTSMGNHGLLRSDTNHPQFVNWPQTKAVSTSLGKYVRETYCCLLGTASLNLPSMWYAFDAGPVRMYILHAAWADTQGGINNDPYEVDAAYHWQTTSPEYQWLKNDLEAHPEAMKMVAWHYPLYSDQKHENSDTFLQGPNSLQGLLNENGVKLAFNGHAHIYQRNLPDTFGMVSYITGAAGAALQSVGENPCAANDAYAIGWSNTNALGNACGAASPPTFASQVFHFLKVTVDGPVVTVAPTDSQGNTFDVQTYIFDSNPPSVPTGVTATVDTAGDVTVSWNPSIDNVAVTAYNVLRDGVVVGSVAAPVTTFVDTTTAASTTYGYTVTAQDAAGNTSLASTPPAIATPPDNSGPSVPANVTAIATSVTQVTVTWTGSTDDVAVTGYDVLRNGAVVGSVEPPTLSYVDAPPLGATHTYTVKARDAAGNQSGSSNAAQVTMVPTKPVGLTLSVTSLSSVTLSWSASTDSVAVTGYDVYRNDVMVASVAASPPSYVDNTVAAGTAYRYQLVAKNLAGSSALSAQRGFGAFVATADSYTNQSKKTSNFGTVLTLLSEKLSTAQKQTYLKFTVPAISGTVTGTALRLNVTDPTVDAPKVFATASNTWTESGLTWNNQPLASGVALADAVGVAVGTLTYSLSAPAAVAGTYSYVLIPDSSNKIGVSSKEASAANRPALIVTFS